MGNEIALGAEKFSHRLNMSGFTNVEKSYSTEEFNKTFTTDKYDIFEKSNIISFVNDIQKTFGTEIKKGGFNDLPEVHATIEKAKEDLKNLKSIFVSDGPGTERNVFVIEKAGKNGMKWKNHTNKELEDLHDSHVKESNQIKQKEGDNKTVKDKLKIAFDIKKELEERKNKEASFDKKEIKKANVDNELEKGVMDSFEYSKNFQFSKKGKDIKEKVALLKAEEELKVKQIEKDIETALEKCTQTPTENYSVWGLRDKVKNPYKVFNWNQTYYNQNSNCETMGNNSGKSIQAAASPEEANCNSKYNDLIRCWIECQVELLLADLYIKNLDDKKSYNLTSEQMVTLNF